MNSFSNAGLNLKTEENNMNESSIFNTEEDNSQQNPFTTFDDEEVTKEDKSL